MHPLVALVKKAVEQFVRKGQVISSDEELSRQMSERAGVFVCLKKDGQLRGCIGTIEPLTGCVTEEAVRNAIASATEDPRFLPVEEHELPGLEYTVDVLCPPEKITSLSGLDPSRYGVIVRKGNRKGLLLPCIEGVDTVQEQLRIAKAKAGIDPGDADIEISRFEVKRFK
ncbi:MAG: AmmeMemoRadiSam system protein A [Nitrospiraceae bacterium]|nr:AmmeMemoRadiSam system protein A [Nitrospiraceae bacterium]